MMLQDSKLFDLKNPSCFESFIFCLVVWNHGFFLTFYILGIVIPTDELIFFRGVGIPPTSCFAMIEKMMPTPQGEVAK